MQLITFSPRIFLCQHPSAIRTWDIFLDSIIHALNCRTIKVMGYTPSQLLLGLNPTRQIAWDLNPESEARLGELEAYVRGIAESSHPLPPSDPELRVATLDEIRQTALNRPCVCV